MHCEAGNQDPGLFCFWDMPEERSDEAISLVRGQGQWLRCARNDDGETMIYMVEMDMRLDDREAEWHEWYLAHIKVLLTVPGFRAS